MGPMLPPGYARERLLGELTRRAGEPSPELARVPRAANERWEIVCALALPNVVFYAILGLVRAL